MPSPSGQKSSECVDDNTIVEFLDGLLSKQEVERVEHHAAQCDECRRLIAELGRSPSIAENALTAPANEFMDLTLDTGQQVGRFVVINRIGSGGMGVVFAAYDPKLDRKVALKLLRSREDTSISLKDAQMRLLREAQAMAQLAHENLVAVYDYGTFKSEVYIAMEFVEGETLKFWLRRWERAWHEVLDKFLQAGRALAHAHSGGLVHRDFKPDNVLIGNDERARVMDFGLARSLFADSTIEQPKPPERPEGAAMGKAARALDHRLTRTGTVLGTPRYMAPEQFEGLETDARSDQFSFCVALYEALYKQHPFKDNTAEGLVRSPQTTKVQPAPSGTKVPAWLHKAVLRGMSPEAPDRFSSMDSLLRAIAPRPKQPPRFRWVPPAIIAVLALLAAIYMYVDRRNTEDTNIQLEGQVAILMDQVKDLTGEISKLKLKIRESANQPVKVERLQRQLEETKRQLEVTKQDLEDALTDLEETQEQLGKVTGKKPKPVQPRRPRGVSEREIRERISVHQADLNVCFDEWSERSSSDDTLFAVRLEIGTNGVPSPKIRAGGIDDQVVYECVTLLLQDLRFPVRKGVTVARVGFFYGSDGVNYQIAIEDVQVPDKE